MAADDFQNLPPDQGFPTDLDAGSSMSGNRPASGARRATPGEVLSQGFQGDQNAGDFLGLDTEFAGQDPNQGYAASPLDLVPPPGTYDDQGYAAVPEPAPQPASDPVQEFAQAPSAFEFGGDLGSEEGELPLEDLGGPTTSRKPLLVGVLLVAALAAGGVMYGPQLYSRYFGSDPKVADDAGKGWEQKPTKPKPATGEPAKPVTDPTSVVAVDPTASKPDAPVTTPKPPATSPLVSSKSPEPARPVTSDPSAGTGLRPTPTTQTPAADPTGPSVAVRPQPVAFPNLGGDEYSWAGEDGLELIWRGSEVPLEALSAPAKTIMPRVGNVRVFTTSGDVLEGRLFAVGQNRVWIDAQPGRIGIDGGKVERIEVLPPVPEGQAKSAEELQLAGSKRVRVRVPGGMLYGRVLKAEGDEVTLALDDGGRVRVKAGDVQELGTGRAVVVRR